MGISHISLDLGLRYQSGNGIHDHDIHGTGTHHGLRDLQSLLAVIRLGNIKIVNIHTDITRIHGIERMLGVDKSGDAAALLYLSNHM